MADWWVQPPEECSALGSPGPISLPLQSSNRRSLIPEDHDEDHYEDHYETRDDAPPRGSPPAATTTAWFDKLSGNSPLPDYLNPSRISLIEASSATSTPFGKTLLPSSQRLSSQPLQSSPLGSLHYQLGAVEDRLTGKLQGLKEHDSLESRVQRLESETRGLQGRLSDFLERQTETHAGHTRRIEALDAGSRDWKNRLQDEIQQRASEWEVRLQKVTTGVRSKVAELADDQQQLQNSIDELEARLEDDRAEFQALLQNLHQELSEDLRSTAAAGAAECRSATQDLAEAWQSKTGELTGLMSDLAQRQKLVGTEFEEFQVRLASMDEQHRSWRTRVESREEQWRAKQQNDLEPFRTQIDSLRKQLTKLQSDEQEHFETLSRRADLHDGGLEDVRGIALRRAPQTSSLSSAEDFGRVGACLEAMITQVSRLETEVLLLKDSNTQEKSGALGSYVDSFQARFETLETALGSHRKGFEERCRDIQSELESHISEVLSHVRTIAPKILEHDRILDQLQAPCTTMSMSYSASASMSGCTSRTLSGPSQSQRPISSFKLLNPASEEEEEEEGEKDKDGNNKRSSSSSSSNSNNNNNNTNTNTNNTSSPTVAPAPNANSPTFSENSVARWRGVFGGNCSGNSSTANGTSSTAKNGGGGSGGEGGGSGSSEGGGVTGGSSAFNIGNAASSFGGGGSGGGGGGGARWVAFREEEH